MNNFTIAWTQQFPCGSGQITVNQTADVKAGQVENEKRAISQLDSMRGAFWRGIDLIAICKDFPITSIFTVGQHHMFTAGVLRESGLGYLTEIRRHT